MFLVNLKRKRDENDMYVYKEVLAIHGVSVSEMEDAEAIDRR